MDTTRDGRDDRRFPMHRVPRLDPEDRSAELGRRILYVIAAVLLSVGSGLAIVHVEPLLVGGGVIGALFALVIIRWPFLGLLLYLLIFLLRLGEMVPALAPLRMERIVGLLTLASLFLAQLTRDGRLSLDRSIVTRRFLLLLLAALLSMPMSYWFMNSWKGVQDFVKLFIFFLMIVQLVDSRRKFMAFATMYVLLIGYISWQSTWAYLSGSILHAQGIDRAIGVTSAGGGPNELGATMACTIPLLLLLGTHKRLGKWRWVFLGLLGLCGYTLMTTGSRSGLVGFLATVAYLVWFSRHRLIYGAIGFVLLTGLFFAMPDQYQERYGTMTQSELDGSSQERIKVWKKGMAMVADRPLFGVGINCFETANALGYSGPRQSWLESHSLYVQVPAEMGLFGVYAFFGLLFVQMRLNRRLRQRMDEEEWALERVILRGMFTGLIALIFTGVFGHSMMRYTWYVFAALTVAIARIYVQSLPEAESSEEQKVLLG